MATTVAGMPLSAGPTTVDLDDPLRERVYDARAPLTARRFLGNIVDAVRLDRLRVPNDPAEARRQLC